MFLRFLAKELQDSFATYKKKIAVEFLNESIFGFI